MNLDPKDCSSEPEILYGHIIFILLHKHLVFIEAPWFTYHYSINISFVIKGEEDFVVPDPLDFEAVPCSPQMGKGLSKSINIKSSESSNRCKNTLKRLDPQIQNNQFKLYDKQQVCGK